jgi:tetratricopeptide (TPR) repeat protein
MNQRISAILVMAAAAVLLMSQARGAAGDDLFQKGESLLAEGDLGGALDAFEAASRAAPLDEDYAARATTLRRVFALRERLTDEDDLAQWVRIARALHLFYHEHGLYDLSLEVDRQIHERLDSGLSASLLTRTLMAQQKNAEAAEMLAALPAEKQTLSTRVMRAIALARAGQKAKAAKVADSVELPKPLCAGKAYLLARMHAAVGDKPKAAALLTAAFKHAPQARLASFKATAQRTAEFDALFADPEYAFVLQTEAAAGHDDHDHDHDDHDHEPGGHCVECPAQDRVADVPAPKPAKESARSCESCEGGSCERD